MHKKHRLVFVWFLIIIFIVLLGILIWWIANSNKNDGNNNVPKNSIKITKSDEKNLSNTNTYITFTANVYADETIDDSKNDKITWDYNSLPTDGSIITTPNKNKITFIYDTTKPLVADKYDIFAKYDNIQSKEFLITSPYTPPVVADKISFNNVTSGQQITLNQSSNTFSTTAIVVGPNSGALVNWTLPSSIPQYLAITTNGNDISVTLTINVTTNEEIFPIKCSIPTSLEITFYIKIEAYQYYDPDWIPLNKLDISNNQLNGLKSGVDISTYTTLYIPANVTTVKNNAFENKLQSNIINLNLQDSHVVTFGEYSFYNATFTNELITNNYLKEIKKYCFYGVQFSKINMSQSTTITTIPEGTFGESNELEELTLPPNLVEISDPSTAGNGAFQLSTRQSKLTGNLIFPSTIQKIGNGAFSRSTPNTANNLCVNLSNCNNLKSIGANAFYGLRNLVGINNSTEITIPNSVTRMGGSGTSGMGYCFEYCERITRIVLSSSIDTSNFKNGMFMQCSSLEEVVINYTGGIYDYNKNYETQPWGKWLNGTKIINNSSSALATGKVYVPNALLSQYQSNANWPSGTNFVGF